MSYLPAGQWIADLEESRASTSAAGQAFFLLPVAREPTEAERVDAELEEIQAHLDRLAARTRSWRARTGRTVETHGGTQGKQEGRCRVALLRVEAPRALPRPRP
jgi:hypothetical protein